MTFLIFVYKNIVFVLLAIMILPTDMAARNGEND